MKLGFHKLTALILVLALTVPFLAACKEETVDLQTVYKFSETAVTLNAGENYALLVYDDTYSDRNYTATWTSSDSSVVSVEQSGFLTALNAGSAIVTASLYFEAEQQTVTLTCNVTVLQTTVSVTGISLSAMEQTLDIGGVTVLTATVLPTDATNKSVTWSSSNSSVAIVTSGVVTAIGEGSAVITATTEDGMKTAECTVTVNAPVDTFESLTLNKTSVTVKVGNTTSLVATVKPEGVAANIIWTSSDESIATVVNGTITGVKAGTATITATLNDKVTNKVASCKVTVQSESSSSGTTSSGSSSGSSSTTTTVKATKVTFDVQSITVYVGQTGPWKFTPTVTPSNTTEKGTWTSSNPSVAAVDSNGNITIGDLGGKYFDTVTITYTVGSKSANGVVVVMSESSNPDKTDDSKTDSSDKTDTSGTTDDKSDDKTDSSTTDTTKKITDLILAESTINIKVGNVYAVEFDAYPKDAVETYTWKSSNESVVTVTSSGVITGKSAGTAKITVTGVTSGISSECTVNVTHTTAESILLSQTNLTLNLGQTATLSANLTPADATDTIVWTSQYPTIVSVDQNGTVTALQSGIVQITATTSTGKTAVCTVSSGITGSDSGYSTGTATSKITVSVYVSATGDLKAGNAYTAYLTFSPSLSQAQLSTCMFAINSSNSNVAKVSRITNDYTKNSFTITPGEDGTATLTGFVNSSDSSLAFEFESKTISVNSPDPNMTNPITSISMTTTSKNLYVNDITTLVASASPYNHNDQVSWSSSNESVVKVITSNGLTCSVQAVGTGTATITCKSKGNNVTNDRTASCKITVSSTGSVDTTRGIIAVSQGTPYTVSNEDIGISGSLTIAPYWTANSVLATGASSADSSYILSIDASGNVSVGANVPIGTSLSTSVRYVDASNTLVSREFTVMVLNSKPTSSSTTASVSATASVGDTGDLSQQYSFANATYESSNPTAVTVNPTSGVWSAVGYGYATITIKDQSSGTTYLEVKFTVDYQTTSARMNVGQSLYITDLISVGNKTVSSVTSNTTKVSISKLNNNIIITASESCTAKLSITYSDNSRAYVELTVGGTGSTSSYPTITASTTSVYGGNSVLLTVTNVSQGSTVNWSYSTSITSGVSLSSTTSSVPWGSTTASVNLVTPSVTSSGTISVWVTIDNVQYSPITITVLP